MSTNVRIPAVFLIVALIGGGTAALTCEQFCEYSQYVAETPAPYFVGGRIADSARGGNGGGTMTIKQAIERAANRGEALTLDAESVVAAHEALYLSTESAVTSELRCWLIWMMDASGGVTLVAVDLTEEARDRHLAAVKHWPLAPDEPARRVFVEKSKVNHLYGDGLQSAVGQRLTVKRGG